MQLAALLLALLALTPALAQNPGTRIGYVDMKRLLDNAPQVIEGRKRLEAEFEGKDRQLKAGEAELAELETHERRDAAILPKAAADALHNKIETLRRTLERTRKQMSEDLKARLDEEFNRRWPEINDAVIAYAREQLADFKAGRRKGTMNDQAAELTDDEMKSDFGAYTGGADSGAAARQRYETIRRELSEQLTNAAMNISFGRDEQSAIEQLMNHVQVYTGMIYRGPFFARDLAWALAERQRRK